MKPDKPVEANNQPTPTAGTLSRGGVTREQISRRAEELWRQRNCPSGEDESIWLEAESQLKAEFESRPVSGTESRPNADEPAQPIHSRTKVQDPAESAVQTRSATEESNPRPQSATPGRKREPGKSGARKR